jgi:hypothetical protein
MSRALRAACVACCVLISVAAPATAQVKQKSLFRGNPQPVGIARDAQGRIHLSWQSRDERLHYMLIDRGKRRDQVVDRLAGSGFNSSIAVDSAGHPHLAYHAERMDPVLRQVLIYARFDGAWQIEELGPGGYATAIAIDADDQPHIVHALPGGAFEYLHRDGGGWERETPPSLDSVTTTPMSLALDAAGHAHVGLEAASHRPYYATNASGEWVATELAAESARGASLALDSLGLPRVALPLAETATIRYRRFDGANWTSEDLYDPNAFSPGLENLPSGAALALDPNDVPRILFTTTFSGSAPSAQWILLAFHDLVTWQLLVLATEDGGDNVGLVGGPDGSSQGVYPLLRSDSQLEKLATVALQDLRAEWVSLSVSGTGVIRHFEGVLTLHNDGAAKARSTSLALFVSDDETLDDSDFPVKFVAGVGRGLAPGESKTLKVKFLASAGVAGKHVIGVLDPRGEVVEVNRANDVFAGLLPQ